MTDLCSFYPENLKDKEKGGVGNQKCLFLFKGNCSELWGWKTKDLGLGDE